MKKLAFAIIACTSMSAPAMAAYTVLTSQWTEGMYRFCKYADGRVINVGAQICPLSLD